MFYATFAACYVYIDVFSCGWILWVDEQIGMTAAMFASEAGEENCLQLLITTGCNVEETEKVHN